VSNRAPTYRFTVGFVARWLASAVLGHRRNVGRDGDALLARYETRVEGDEQIPRSGPLIVVMNHCERPGMRVWWPALLVTREVWRIRGEEPPLRWMVTDRFHGYRLGPLRIPDRIVASAMRRIADVYGLIVVARAVSSAAVRSAALRAASDALHGSPPRSVGITPEADLSSGRALMTPWRNAGAAIAMLSGGAVPVLPVAVYEDSAQRLVARFGPPFVLKCTDRAVGAERRGAREAVGQQVMRALAHLLPADMRGPFAGS
jgi:hypothetical protein